MLMPKKTKYRKVQKGRVRGRAKGATTLIFGDYGLEAVESGRVSARQIEAIRVTMGRKLKKVGTLFMRLFPQKPITKKPAETRMGKGKGNPEYWVDIVKRGRILCEVSGVDRAYAKEVLNSATYKLPIKTRVISKQDIQDKLGN
ncbi:50S ribosomal protein L16 [Candidatus Babeliales bacterium]|nr:50S ribosomal protein L16 [Candidatus Babeliales bacterium]